MDALTRIWPLFGLRLRLDDLELRLPRDTELAALVDLSAQGVHAPEQMPFQVPWTRRESPELERTSLQYHWTTRGAWSPDEWRVDLGVWAVGELVGAQGIRGKDFAVTRTVSTGSWLGTAHHGRGIGTAMRTAMLALAFDGLGAQRAETGAFADNPASLGVTRKLGYRANGDQVHDREGTAATELHFAMTVDDWHAAPRPPVEIEGLEPCLALFGAA